MFYRVDYTLAVLVAGLVLGALLGGRTARMGREALARWYYVIIAVLLVLRTALFAWSMVGHPGSAGKMAGGIAGDLGGLLFGALFGMALRRDDSRLLLTDSAILGALSISLAFTFTLAALGKAFTPAPMTDFFTQSGYPAGFLTFIVIAEAFGAIGLLLPWAVVPALLGLAVDMFGAIFTHIHNGDPLNDSTGAISLLIRMIAFGILWTLRPRQNQTATAVRSSVLRVAGAAVLCLLLAFAGSMAVRHASALPAAGSAPTRK